MVVVLGVTVKFVYLSLMTIVPFGLLPIDEPAAQAVIVIAVPFQSGDDPRR